MDPNDCHKKLRQVKTFSEPWQKIHSQITSSIESWNDNKDKIAAVHRLIFPRKTVKDEHF